jgi:D-3-phosphoglycerate dehydrogenase / 2-oxoglutarate reductase
MKILIVTEKPFAPVAVIQIRQIAESEGHEVVILESYRNVSAFIAAVADADALIVRSDIVSGAVINAAIKLKIVVRAGAGYDNLDLQACTARGIVAMNTPGQNSNAVAELAFELMLYNARMGFSGKTGTELRGKTLGLHGFGNVGRFMAGIARGFGMKDYAYDPYIGDAAIKAATVRVCRSPEELYSTCQYVSIHIPANEKTRKSIGYDLLKLMPPNAVVVNTARKEVIDEEGLLRIFAERSDIKYLSDVEPDCKTVFEEKFNDRFIFTARKMGAQTKEANINAAVAAAHQIIDYFKNGNEKFRVN